MKILVPLDGSKFSEAIIGPAGKLLVNGDTVAKPESRRQFPSSPGAAADVQPIAIQLLDRPASW